MATEIPDAQLATKFGVLNAPPGGAVPGDDYYDDGTGANPEGRYVLTGAGWVNVTAGGGGGALEVLDEGAPVDPAVTSMDFVGAGVTVASTGPGAVEVNIPGGGGGGGARDERPTDYRELTTMPQTPVNGFSSQRCSTVLADGRQLFLWADNATGALYLTVVKQFFSTQLETQRHTRTYRLQLFDYTQEGPINFPESECGDLCIVCEPGGPLEGEMVHIGVIMDNLLSGGRDCYDAYFPSQFIPTYDLPGFMNNQAGDPGLNLPAPYGDGGVTPELLWAERVNYANPDFGLTPCRHVSMCSDINLISGPGVVTVYCQTDTENPGYEVYGNYYEPNAPAGQRYNPLSTGYQEFIVSKGITGACSHPTVETDSTLSHCAYYDGLGNIEYSNESALGLPGPPGPPMVPWTNQSPVPINSYGSANGFTFGGPTMVLVDNQEAMSNHVVVVAVGDGNLWAYAFSSDLALGPPAHFFENQADMLDVSKDDITLRYQLGCSQQTLLEIDNEQPMLYLYMCHQPNMVAGVGNNLDFVVLMKLFSSLYNENPNAWPIVSIEVGFPLAGGAVSPFFSPKVSYSFDYNNRGWQDPDTTPNYYPSNYFARAKIQYSGAVLTHRWVMMASEFIMEGP